MNGGGPPVGFLGAVHQIAGHVQEISTGHGQLLRGGNQGEGGLWLHYGGIVKRVPDGSIVNGSSHEWHFHALKAVWEAHPERGLPATALPEPPRTFFPCHRTFLPLLFVE